MAEQNEHKQNENNNNNITDDTIPAIAAETVHSKKEQHIVETENSKFIEKAEIQVNRIFKELESLTFHGSKSELSNEVVETVVHELREQSNLARKQFSMNTSDKNFGSIASHIQKVVREIKALGELSNKHSGEYEDDHIKAIFDAIKKKTNETKKELKEKDKKDDKFTF